MTDKSTVRLNDLKLSFKRNLIPALFVFVMFFAAFVLNAVNEFNSRALDSYSSGRTVLPYNLYYWLAGMIICGVIMALISFSFLLKKAKNDMMLSAGVARSELFENRVLSAAVLMSGAVILPVAGMIAVNAYHLGAFPALWTYGVMLSLTLITGGMIGFAAGALACVLVGNMYEAVALTGGMLLTPYLVLQSADFLWAGFIGNQRFIYRGLQGVNDDWYQGTLYDAVSFLNPFRFPFIGRKQNNCIVAAPADADTGVSLGLENILPLLLWIIAAAVGIAFAKRLLRRRPAERVSEIFGSTAEKTVLAFVCAATAFILLDSQSSRNYVGIAILAGFAVFILAGVLLWRGVKPFVRKSYLTSVCLAPAAVMLAVLAVGGLDAGAIPKAEKVASVRVSAPSDLFYNNGSFVELDLADLAIPESYMFGPSDDRSDIEKLVQLNRDLENDKGGEIKFYVKFEYTLKNGTVTSKEYHSVSRAWASKLGEIYKLKCADSVISNILLGKPTEQFGHEVVNRRLLYSKSGKIGLLDNSEKIGLFTENGKRVSDLKKRFSRKQLGELLAALYEDYKAADGSDFAAPDEKPIGELRFADILYAKTADGRDKEFTDREFPHFDYKINLFADMKATTDFLKKAGLLSALIEPTELFSARVFKLEIPDYDNDRWNNGIYRICAIRGRVRKEFSTGKPLEKITNKTMLNKLYSRSFMSLRGDQAGYIVIYKTGNYEESRVITKKDYKDIIYGGEM